MADQNQRRENTLTRLSADWDLTERDALAAAYDAATADNAKRVRELESEKADERRIASEAWDRIRLLERQVYEAGLAKDAAESALAEAWATIERMRNTRDERLCTLAIQYRDLALGHHPDTCILGNATAAELVEVCNVAIARTR